MGMDLYPRNRELDRFHFNWTYWKVLGDLLESLGCDLSQMAGMNDGKLIKAKTCRDWAKAIRLAIKHDKINSITVKDNYGSFDGFEIVEKDGELSQDDKEWLLNICLFLDDSSGCRQF